MPRIIASAAVAVCSLLLFVGQAAAQGGGGGGGTQQQGGGTQQQGGGTQTGGGQGGGGGGANQATGFGIQGGLGIDTAAVGETFTGSTGTDGGQGFALQPTSQDGFVGSSAADIQARQATVGGQTAAAAIQQASRTSIGGAANRNANANRQNQGSTQQLPFRVQLVPGPGLVRVPIAAVQPQLLTSVQNAALRRGTAAPDLEFNGRMVTLRGTAASEGDRLYWESRVKIRPGISQVVNEMTVVESPSADSGLSLQE